jgi:hypothetical protein
LVSIPVIMKKILADRTSKIDASGILTFTIYYLLLTIENEKNYFG